MEVHMRKSYANFGHSSYASLCLRISIGAISFIHYNHFKPVYLMLPWLSEWRTELFGLINIYDKDLWQLDSYFVQQGKNDQ